MLRFGLLMAFVALPAHADTPFDQRKPPPKPVQPVKQGYTGLGAESITPAEIAKFAPPPLDPAVSRRIQALMDIRGAGSGALTSKGDRMFFNSKLTGSTQIWRQDGPLKLPVQLTGGEDATTLVGIAPDDSFLVVARDIGGQENPGLYLQKPTGGPLVAIQALPKIQTSLMFISDDSKSIYFRSNDLVPTSYALYRYDIATQKRELVFDKPGLWSIEDHRNGAWLLRNATGSAFDEIWQYDLATKQLTPLFGQNEQEEYQVRFGAKPNQLLVRTNKPSDFHRLYRVELAKRDKLEPISPDVKHDVEAFWIDEARLRIYYTTNEAGISRLAALDAKTLKPLALPKPPANTENTSFTGVSRSGRYLHLAYDGAITPSMTITYDWQLRKSTTWRWPAAPEVDTQQFARASLESYPARDGTAIPMFVRRPAACNPAPCPVVVAFHGGPEGQSRGGFSPAAQMFVDAGFVFVEPNVRGSTGYGKAWMRADDGPKRLAVVTDIEDAAKHIRTAWAVNGKAPKVGVMGGSYGGYSTLMAMTYFAGAYDAGVQTVGISNLVSFLENTAPYRRALRITEYGDPVKDREALVQLSPITHVKKLAAPLLSIQGVNDPRVPVGEALQIYKEAEARKIPGGLILFADEGHGASKRGNQVLSIGHTIAFFEKYLK